MNDLFNHIDCFQTDVRVKTITEESQTVGSVDQFNAVLYEYVLSPQDKILTFWIEKGELHRVDITYNQDTLRYKLTVNLHGQGDYPDTDELFESLNAIFTAGL